MRIFLSVAATCLFLFGLGCGMPFETVVGVDGNLLGDDGNSNLLRVPLGSVHDVKGSVGRSEGVLSRWTETVDSIAVRNPEIVNVERLGPTTFRLTAAREGETVLDLVGDGEARTIPIRVMPSDWTPPSPSPDASPDGQPRAHTWIQRRSDLAPLSTLTAAFGRLASQTPGSSCGSPTPMASSTIELAFASGSSRTWPPMAGRS